MHSDPFEETLRYGRAFSRRRAEKSLPSAAKVAFTVVCSILGTIFGSQAVPCKITFTWNETLGWSPRGILLGEGSMLNAPIRFRNRSRLIGSRNCSLLEDSCGCVIFKLSVTFADWGIETFSFCLMMGSKPCNNVVIGSKVSTPNKGSNIGHNPLHLIDDSQKVSIINSPSRL